MGILRRLLRETISEHEDRYNEIVEQAEDELREVEENDLPLIGRLEAIDNEEVVDDAAAAVIREALDESKRIKGDLGSIKGTIEIEPPHEMIDYGTSLSGHFAEQFIDFEDIEAKTEDDEEGLSEEISKTIQALNEDW